MNHPVNWDPAWIALAGLVVFRLARRRWLYRGGAARVSAPTGRTARTWPEPRSRYTPGPARDLLVIRARTVGV